MAHWVIHVILRFHLKGKQTTVTGGVNEYLPSRDSVLRIHCCFLHLCFEPRYVLGQECVQKIAPAHTVSLSASRHLPCLIPNDSRSGRKCQPSSNRGQTRPRVSGCSHRDRVAQSTTSCTSKPLLPLLLCAHDQREPRLPTPVRAASLASRVSRRDTCHTRGREQQANGRGPRRPVESTLRPGGLAAREPQRDAVGTSTQAAVSQAYQIGAGPGR
ncbi:hypothetical protein F5883DRAFT_19130 [Diaporthe sp. PMI_573]|nr:hypothetical protein F5883DRAFT_19130 [Diaporthaceae sp. PMI_573]